MAKELDEEERFDTEYFATSDRPTSEDELGFDPYISAVKQFLTHKQTDAPLTLSVEGDWGAGKSSFLLQLEEALSEDGEHTIRFNPWRHDREDQLWAAFAIQFFEQLSRQVGTFQRWRGHFRLYLRRIEWNEGKIAVLRNALLTFIALVTVVGLPLLFTSILGQLIHDVMPGEDGAVIGTVSVLFGTGGIALSLVGLITLWIRIRDEVRNAVKLDISTYVKSPDYQSRVPFIEEFHSDFAQIIKSYADGDPVYVFIDDLDRCEIPKAADLMKAINMMVSGEANLFFIIAMDRETVAASVAAKHESILPYVNKNWNKEDDDGTIRSEEIQFGYKYTEKFIEVPFKVPDPAIENIDGFVESLTNPSSENNQTDIDRWYHSSGEMDDFSATLKRVTTVVSESLDHNPRRIKKFVNLYRLRALLAKERGILDHKRGVGIGVTLEQLGKFVALTLQHPPLITDLSSDPTALCALQNYALSGGEKENLPDVAKEWADKEDLLSLLTAGCDPDAVHDPLSFKDANVEFLLQITPESSQKFSGQQRITVRIKKSLGEIYGIDGRTYHLEKADVVSLPAANAVPLLEQGGAVPLDSDKLEGSTSTTVDEEELLNSVAERPPEPQDSWRRITIRVIDEVGDVSGVDGRHYELREHDVVSLPAPTAIPLIEQGLAEVRQENTPEAGFEPASQP